MLQSRRLVLTLVFALPGAFGLASCGGESGVEGACGNGLLEPGETCDFGIAKGQPGACPDIQDCSDGDPCTTDRVMAAATCQASCTHTRITQPIPNDGCCFGGDPAVEPECYQCGNGVVEAGERCDTQIRAGLPGACPIAADCPGSACKILVGAGCMAHCEAITQPNSTTIDQCCPPGGNALTDIDCGAVCGNGVVEPTEQCDTAITSGAGHCSSGCDDGAPCTADQLSGTECQAQCVHTIITAVGPVDGCCPTGANHLTDSDCSASCGNGVVEPPETCDTAAPHGNGGCPVMADCVDSDPCTVDDLLSAGTCQAQCTNTPITRVGPADGCCPSGANANNDQDCAPQCGNGVVEMGEKCDTAIAVGQQGACPRSGQAQLDCDDGNACTDETVTGSGCQAQCVHTTETSPGSCRMAQNGCCPSGCTNVNDGDCAPSCSDTVQDGTESDIDCGGTCSTCTVGKMCGGNGDCNSMLCRVSQCQLPDAPVLTGTSPSSPANNNNPRIQGTAMAGTTVRLYTNAGCSGTVAGSDTAANFASPGIRMMVAANSMTTFYATATDAAMNISACSSAGLTYVEDSTPPAVPSGLMVAPASPANENNPVVSGTSDAGSTVRLFANSTCIGTPLALGTAAAFASPGFTVSVGDDTTTTFYADAMDPVGNTSSCSAGVTFVEDSTAPAAPTGLGVSPASPANDNMPHVSGSAAGGSTVRIYGDALCMGMVLATGTAAAFGSPGLSVSVADNTSNTFYATATDSAGNASACSTSFAVYIEDSMVPGAPTALSVAPASPANDTDPQVSGTAEAGSTVRIYTDAACMSTVAAVGSAAAFAAPGLPVHVANDSTTTFYATATDAAGNASVCSTSFVTYVEDSMAPAAPTGLATVPASPSQVANPRVTGTAEAGSKVHVFGNGSCTGMPLAMGTAEAFASPGFSVAVMANTTRMLAATATDAAGNDSGCSGAVTYTEDEMAPMFGGATGAMMVSSSSISVAWSAASDTVTPAAAVIYDICASTATGDCVATFVVTQSSAPGDTSATVGGLTAATEYYIVVRARDEAGNRDTNVMEVTATTGP